MKQRYSKGWLTAVLLALLVPILVYSYAEGPPPARTGGFGESDCTACHRGTAVNAGGGSVAIAVSSSAYSSGGAYQIAVSVSDPVQQRWGFELSARTQDGKQAGTLQPSSDGFTQLAPSSNGIQYIEHTVNGTRNGTKNGVTFNFTWTAPDVSAGPVVFNAAGNAANGDFTNNGDHIYTTSLNLQPATPVTSSGPAPAVNDSGVVNNASFAPGTSPLAPGSIAAIFGSNLNDGSTVLSSSFGADGKLLTTLGGAQVTINGAPAPLFYSTPSQLGVQIPTDLAAGSAAVQVTVGGQTSATQTLLIDASAPGVFSLSQDGKGQGAVLIANTDIIAAPAGSIPGRSTRPAQPGEFITIFSTGLGQVNPPLDTGVAATANATVSTPSITIDGVPANVQFSGMAPGFVGLNQVNVQVPAGTRSASNIPVVLTIDGKQSNTVTIAVSGP